MTREVADQLHGLLTGMVAALVWGGIFFATDEWILAISGGAFVLLLMGTLWFGRPSA